LARRSTSQSRGSSPKSIPPAPKIDPSRAQNRFPRPLARRRHPSGCSIRRNRHGRSWTSSSPASRGLDEDQLRPAEITAANNDVVLVMSLSSWYYEWIKTEYGGGVHLPSHEGEHRWGDSVHCMKALGEMYLLSTCDVLVTSGFSNERRAGARRGAPFGDAEAVAVGGVEGGPGGAEPPCRRVLSVEPSLIFSRRRPWLLDLLSGGRFSIRRRQRPPWHPAQARRSYPRSLPAVGGPLDQRACRQPNSRLHRQQLRPWPVQAAATVDRCLRLHAEHGDFCSALWASYSF
jgi:hypothetical protein